MMRLSPDELDPMTGLRFVSLAMPGVGPAEQIATARAFIRHHPRDATLVWGLGHEWCETKPPERPFPFWLYGDSGTYVRHILLSPSEIPRSVGVAARRLKVLFGRSPPKGPANGYEAGHLWWKKATAPDPNMKRPREGEPIDGPMPAIAALSEFIEEVDPGRLVFVVPPVFANMIPLPGSVAALRRDACNAAIRDVISTQPAIALIDLVQDTPATRDSANFVDAGHYRDNIARMVEQAIADALVAEPDLRSKQMAIQP
jgi:hypothetical protein